MTPWQEGFVKQCEARKVDPRAVAKFASEYARGQEAAKQQLAKRAEAAKKAFDSMTPYQQGFAVRCHQRGIPAEKVATWVMHKKAQSVEEISDFKTKAQLAGEKARAAADSAAASETGYGSEDAALAAMAAAAEAERAAAEEKKTKAMMGGLGAFDVPDEVLEEAQSTTPTTREQVVFKTKRTLGDALGKAKDFAKGHKGAIAGGGAALTAALLGAYLLSRRKKKKAKK